MSNEPLPLHRLSGHGHAGEARKAVAATYCLESFRASKRVSSGPEESLTWSLQCLLARHEAYVAEAERKQAQMATTISSLESSNDRLQRDNAQYITENQALLGQLECFNTTIAAGDAQIKSLSSALSSAQMEIHTLQFLTQRTQKLEQQLTIVENEQAALHEQLITTKDEERAAKAKWRDSQRQIGELMDQLEAIEREAAEERVRHAEVMQKVKAQEARRKDASPKRDSAAVGNFVKQILQDNTNLQMTMVELQELLAHSKSEMDAMRDQLNEVQASVECSRPNLRQELEQSEEKQSQPLGKPFHVHHHYHAARQQQYRRGPVAPRQKPPRKSSRLSGRSTPLSESDYALDLAHSRQTSVASSASSNALPPAFGHHRLSSGQGYGYAFPRPSSPGSTYCPSTVFERPYDDMTDYSRPTSPESNGLMSPVLGSTHRKDFSQDSSFAPGSLPTRFGGLTLEQELMQSSEEARRSEAAAESHERGKSARRMSPIPSEVDAGDDVSPPASRQRLRRTASHASIHSISGMDIHSSFPEPERSPTRQRAAPPFALRSRPSIITSASQADIGPVLSNVQAQQYARKDSAAGSWKTLRTTLETVPEGKSKDRYAFSDTFGRRVGGWLSGRWSGGSKEGETPAPPSATAPAPSSSSTVTPAAPAPKMVQRSASDSLSILSAASSEALQVQKRKEDPSQLRSVATGDETGLVSEDVDHEALAECLAEG